MGRLLAYPLGNSYMKTEYKAPTPTGRKLLRIFHRLYDDYGPQRWWPGDGPFETIVGAILTQNTAWRNAARAIDRLKEEGVLCPAGLRELATDELASLIKSSGYFNMKARKLKAFAEHLGDGYGDDLDEMLRQEPDALRRELLSIYGIGEETADDIVLYAGGWPVFVIDAYTRRILERLELVGEGRKYAELQAFFHEHLPRDTQLFNEYHALLDHHAGVTCVRRDPRCADCSLLDMCPTGKKRVES